MKETYTIGELAKEMKVSVRTLQYYDKINLLKPAMLKEGNRRVYTNRELLQLHQILSLKYLGLSLVDIRKHLPSMDTPEEVLHILHQQIKTTKQTIEDFQKALLIMEKMSVEIQETKIVDFQKYATIIGFIRLNRENYWVMDSFDDQVIKHLEKEFKEHPEEGVAIYHKYQEMVEVFLSLQDQNIASDSEQAIAIAKEWWDMVMEFTKGDMSLLQNLENFNNNKDQWDPIVAEKQKQIDAYMGEALEAYFKAQGTGDE